MSLLPSQLSPSSAGDFQQCPKLFHFKKVLGRPSYSNQASAAGRLTHLVLDEIFEFSPGERTSMVAKEIVVPAWRAITNPLADDDYLMTPLEREIRSRNGLWRHAVESGSKEEAEGLTIEPSRSPAGASLPKSGYRTTSRPTSTRICTKRRTGKFQ